MKGRALVLSYCPSLPDEKEEETTLDDGVLWKPAVLAQLPAVIYQVACGEDFVLALAGNGELWSWGENDMGVLGVGDTKYRVNPVRVTTMLQAKREKSGSGSKKHDKSGKSQRKVETFSMPAIYHIAAGTSHCLALIEGPEDSRVVLSWGHGSRGQLGIKERLLDRYTAAITGDGATACPPDTLLKPCVIPQLSKLQVITVAAGNDHSGAVTSMGRLYMWGSNEFGQVTDPSMTWYSFIVEYSTLLHFFWICP
ncbi:Rcbtb1, partial [Symbiodinium sp. KB8]